MPTAPAADQRRLLVVQDLDARGQTANHRRATHPSLATIAGLEARARVLGDDLVTRSTEVSDLKRQVTKAEDDVQSVRSRAQRDAAKLDAGQGSPKDLQALQSEIESLAHRQSDLEDVELELMERLEGAESGLASVKAEVDEVVAGIATAATERDAAFAVIDAELAGLTAERATAVAGLDEGLLALYEKLRASHGGVGAAALHAGGCGGCHVKVDPTSLAEFAASPEDSILRCDECGRILIREA